MHAATKQNMRSAFDRLSDDVICHIISFLPTNTSASTSVLARRWRFLWTHNPNLVFDEFDLRIIPLHRIIQRHRAKTFNTLSLTNVKCSDNQLATWISHAVNRGVRNIHLDFGVPGDLYYAFVEDREVDISSLFALPRFLLTCKTLVDLKIRCCKGIPSSGEVFLPSLKKLDLCCVVYDDEASLPHLLSGCPVLEDLTVECVYSMKLNGDYLGCVFVSSPTIKILKVDLEHGCFKLKINTPSLEFLYLINYSLEYITSLTTMTSLKEAHITLIQNFNDEDEYAAPAVKFLRNKFLNCLCNLEYLYISIDSGEKLVHIVGLGSVVKFVNLTKLKLELMFDFHELVEFLEAADKLKHLTFTLRGKQNTYREPKQVPTCMLSCLKTVRINPFEDFNAHDFESIRYILRNAQVLERMEIHSSSLDRIYKEDLEEELEMLGRIPLLERGSESCQIVFC